MWCGTSLIKSVRALSFLDLVMIFWVRCWFDSFSLYLSFDLLLKHLNWNNTFSIQTKLDILCVNLSVKDISSIEILHLSNNNEFSQHQRQYQQRKKFRWWVVTQDILKCNIHGREMFSITSFVAIWSIIYQWRARGREKQREKNTGIPRNRGRWIEIHFATAFEYSH